MNKINEKDLKNINGGGGISFTTIVGIGVLVTFIAGVLDGITNPSKCNA